MAGSSRELPRRGGPIFQDQGKVSKLAHGTWPEGQETGPTFPANVAWEQVGPGQHPLWSPGPLLTPETPAVPPLQDRNTTQLPAVAGQALCCGDRREARRAAAPSQCSPSAGHLATSLLKPCPAPAKPGNFQLRDYAESWGREARVTAAPPGPAQRRPRTALGRT
ncbi:hypothetical protein MC885_015782 [Smutsia gigantea]|nr:hypothetical protein MC885_015782 [Smutsia gigantea]